RVRGSTRDCAQRVRPGPGRPSRNRADRVCSAEQTYLFCENGARPLVTAACDRRHQQHLISILECVARATQESDVFLVHINIQEAAHLAGLVAQVRFEVGKFFVQGGEQFSEIGCATFHLSDSGGMMPQCTGDLYSDAHADASTGARSEERRVGKECRSGWSMEP